MKRNKRRKIWLIPTFTVVLAVAVGVIWKMDVFGKFLQTDPYVAQDSSGNDVSPESAQVIVTDEGPNQKGKQGSGKKPCSDEVPTCEGKKGSETNPFVILEIVPSQDQQQMSYLAGNEESGLPFDAVEFSSKVLPNGRSYTSGESVVNLGVDSNFGAVWLTRTNYGVYDIGKTSVDDMTTMKVSEVGKYYTLDYGIADIKKLAEVAGKNPEQELSKFKNAYNNGNGTIKQMYEACPYLFEKDTTDKEVPISKIAINDERNWTKKNASKGYIVVTKCGEGDFSFDGWNIKLPESWETPSSKKWVYSATKPSGKDLKNDLGIETWNVWNDITGKESDDHVGDYFKLSDLSGVSPNGLFEAEETYTFEYYGLKFNEVLKRSLFSFSTQKECDDFHMKVISMTPDELNKISEKDTDDTVDMIERADMYFIQSGYTASYGTIEGTTELSKIYHKWVLGEDNFNYQQNRDANTFLDSDLEWSSVMKIIKRVSETRNLPLMFNMPVGTMLNVGVQQTGGEDVCMYVTSEKNYMHKEGSLNNIAKLYLITAQFDLSARKSGGYTQTFMEDIYPSLQQIQVNDKNVKTAKMTGFYNRKQATGCSNAAHSDIKYQNRANYLWNTCTFYPESIPWSNDPFSKGADNTKQFVDNGFFESYLTEVNANPFINSLAQQARGASVDDMKNGVDKNVGNVGAQLADMNESTLLHPSRESDTVGFDYLGIISHTILEAEVETVENMTVTVLRQKKEYVKVADTSILLDYSSDLSYGDNDMSYVKVQINANGNNEPGVVSKIVMKKGSDKKTLKLYKSKDFVDSNLCDTETYADKNRTVSGYKVDGSLIGYIPYSLKDWADGYTTIEVTTVGRIYNGKNKWYMSGDDFPTDINIGERTLFNLE